MVRNPGGASSSPPWTARLPLLSDAAAFAARDGAAIAIDTNNPRYFTWRGAATALLSSGEHYGALLNLDFDYRAYLAALAADGFNLAQIFSGTYVEPDADLDNPPGSNIDGNTLSPRNNSYLSPWGIAKGSTKLNLTEYNSTYFERLVALAAAADERGVVLEVSLFCGYEVGHAAVWRASPFNPANNVQGVPVEPRQLYSLSAPAELLSVQMEAARRIVRALRPFDNVLVQLAFMPSALGSDEGRAWGRSLAAVVAAADPLRLLVAPAAWALPQPHADFVHRPTARPQTAARPVLADSWGTLCANDSIGAFGVYLGAYWGWLLGGGAGLYNVDFSYTIGHEAGTRRDNYTRVTPSGAAYRAMVRAAAGFARALPLGRLEPRTDWVSPPLPSLAPRATTAAGATAAGAKEMGGDGGDCDDVHATFVNDSRRLRRLRVRLPAGPCEAEWTDAATGATARGPPPTAPNGTAGGSGWRDLVVPQGGGVALACAIRCCAGGMGHGWWGHARTQDSRTRTVP